MDASEYLDWLALECASFAQVLASGDLDAAVPYCPGWQLRDLGSHLGGVHRWARGCVLGADPRTPFEAGPTKRDALLTWYVEGATSVQDTLRELGPDAPSWTMAGPGTALYWMRRQAQETAVHRWDAQSSQGVSEPLDARLAADGIGEVVEMWFPRLARRGQRTPLTRSARIDIDDGATFVLAGDGQNPLNGERSAEATIAGPAEALLLLLWGRTTIDDPRIRISGDRAAAVEVLSANLTP
jgi:uncharacterized protein (TIGR03083 family)